MATCKNCKAPIEDDTNGFCNTPDDKCWKEWSKKQDQSQLLEVDPKVLLDVLQGKPVPHLDGTDGDGRVWRLTNPHVVAQHVEYDAGDGVEVTPMELVVEPFTLPKE